MGKKRIVFFAYLPFFTIFMSFSFAGITKESPFSIGQTLSSSNGVYELGFFSLNNSQNQYLGIWFKSIIPQVVVWVANREKPVTDSAANLGISSNGSLLLSNGKHGVVWSTGDIFASNGSRAELTDHGNLVFIDKVSGRTLWQSFEHLGNTLLPTSIMMYNLVAGEKRGLTAWKSYTDPSPGEFVALITPQVPSQGIIMRGSTRYYRTGPWAKTRFTGSPQMDESYTSPFILTQDVNGSGYFSFVERGKPSRMILTSEGTMKVLVHNGMDWESTYEGPANSCDIYGVCGPFGLCVVSIPPKCKCFKGFVPKFAKEWKKGNWTSGCVRRTELHCQGNSSGKDANVFYTVPNIKPPDFYEYANSQNAEECHQNCLHNCSCLAFSYIPGIGCLMWSKDLMDTRQFSAAGELLSIRLARSELDVNKRKMTIVASTVSLTLFVIFGFAAFGFWRCRVEHNAHISNDAWRNFLQSQDVPGLEFFEMNAIQTATNNFSLSNKLGPGGFGSVYKGKLQDGREIAVKRLSSSSGQGKQEFMNEIVLISKLQHRNLVRVLGCCVEGTEKLLIYGFLKNKSLDTFVFDARKKLELDWPKRFEIIEGIARGLLYLHRDSRLRVIHRDLKGTQYQEKTRRVVGTLGYMSPEYAWTGVFSEKSDIYSFGVLLLEIISGKKISSFSYGEEGKALLAYAWECWCETREVNFLDQALADSSHPSEVGRCVQIGLLCVQHEPADRPNTLELLSMLTTTSDLPLPKKPTFVVHTRKDESPSNDSMITVNEMTESVIQGR
ncbi:Protein kinase domain [Arabidopsis thaliana x Arabidopsis arenosa]|uniref:Receptor-like serine/threonine-protein kinase n=1 Tax=Arabidopsis thaliana x Arabidopsis arenosa TaxID=1240361 RepID=A0A8T2GS48_9BRAS|nr:Protein kinase domain [Arabidopsis thaliana x Arabidopsis arenosa]